MHDIDRTTLEFGNQESEGESFEFGESEWEGGGILSEEQEAELANDLLNVSTEAELDMFLGDIIKKVGSVASGVIRSPVGKAIGGVLKGVAKKALPLAGGALGGYFGGPLGAKIGRGLASAAGGALGLEAEGGGEDREYEGARRFVRLAADTVHKAAKAGAQGGDPRRVAQQAATVAARKHAPGLLQKGGAAAAGGTCGVCGASKMGQLGGMAGGFGGGMSGGQSGRWSRQGNNIVLHGA